MGRVIIQLIVTDTKMIESVCAKKFVKQNLRPVDCMSKLTLLIVFRFAVGFLLLGDLFYNVQFEHNY